MPCNSANCYWPHMPGTVEDCGLEKCVNLWGEMSNSLWSFFNLFLNIFREVTVIFPTLRALGTVCRDRPQDSSKMAASADQEVSGGKGLSQLTSTMGQALGIHLVTKSRHPHRADSHGWKGRYPVSTCTDTFEAA